MTLEGQKVVSVEEMSRLENEAELQGYSKAHLMDNSARVIADAAEAYIKKFNPHLHISLLTGKGNNAGDAFTAGIRLLEKGFSVGVFPLFPLHLYGSLCRQRFHQFEKTGGKIYPVGTLAFGDKGIILDGIVGTGFEGEIEGILQSAIIQANQSKLPILAIDIPSGVHGTTGEVGSVAIHATQTIYLGLPKIGFYIGHGWDHVGTLVGADVGLPSKLIDQAHTQAYLLKDQSLSLPPFKRSRHKYEAGYVVGIGGSKEMSGAPLLSSLSTLRSGAGIIRLFHSTNMPQYPFSFEIIQEVYHPKRVFEECKRASSLFIGPGLGKTPKTKKLLKQLLPLLTVPTICDADALFFLNECSLPKRCILTPHRREMERLLPGQTAALSTCQAYADQKNVTLLLKGAPSFIFHPQTKPLHCNPWRSWDGHCRSGRRTYRCGGRSCCSKMPFT